MICRVPQAGMLLYSIDAAAEAGKSRCSWVVCAVACVPCVLPCPPRVPSAISPRCQAWPVSCVRPGPASVRGANVKGRAAGRCASARVGLSPDGHRAGALIARRHGTFASLQQTDRVHEQQGFQWGPCKPWRGQSQHDRLPQGECPLSSLLSLPPQAPRCPGARAVARRPPPLWLPASARSQYLPGLR